MPKNAEEINYLRDHEERGRRRRGGQVFTVSFFTVHLNLLQTHDLRRLIPFDGPRSEGSGAPHRRFDSLRVEPKLQRVERSDRVQGKGARQRDAKG